MDAYTGRRAGEPHAREGGCVLGDGQRYLDGIHGCRVQYPVAGSRNAVNTVSGEMDEWMGDKATYPVPRPSMTKYPTDVPIPTSAAPLALNKPMVTSTINHATHIWGRYRPVALTDRPAKTAAGANTETESINTG